jgi:RNA polymerase sigma-70 factor (sigma-E family)
MDPGPCSAILAPIHAGRTRHRAGRVEQPFGHPGSLCYVNTDTAGEAARPLTPPGRRIPRHGADSEAARNVTLLHEAHALGLVRLAIIMLGDPGAAEDVVQDAFLGLYRRWHTLADPASAPAYLRSSVLNGCRTAARRRSRRDAAADAAGTLGGTRTAESAEALAMLSEEHREVLAAIRTLPARQRETLVLRYYLDMTEADVAAAMGISVGTVKSATSRALAALARTLKEAS